MRRVISLAESAVKATDCLTEKNEPNGKWSTLKAIRA